MADDWRDESGRSGAQGAGTGALGCGGGFLAAGYLFSIFAVVTGRLGGRGVAFYFVALAALVGLLAILRALVARHRREHGATRDGDAGRTGLFRGAQMVAVFAVAASLAALALTLWPSAAVALWAGYLLLCAAAICGVVALILFVVGGLLRAGTPKPSKEQVVREELMGIFGPAVYYDPGGQLVNNPLQTFLVSPAAEMRQDDHIFGQYKGIDFEQADLNLQEAREYYDPRMDRYEEERRTVFNGRWIAARFPKTITGRVAIFSQNAWAMERDRVGRLSLYQPVEMEDAAFAGYFTVLATDPHEAFFVLTPPVIERLKRLANVRDDASGAPVMLYVEVVGGILHVGVNGIHNAFDSAALLSIDEAEMRARVRADMQVAVDILEGLLQA